MDINRIHPELRKKIGRMPALPTGNKYIVKLCDAITHWVGKSKQDEEVLINDIHIEHCRIRLYRPKGKLSGVGLVWIHGGGYIMGSVAINDRECSMYAKALKGVVVSVNYRLAFEQPFPAAIDDCFDAWQWLQKNAESIGVNNKRIAIAGQSAGGGLAANLCNKIIDEGGNQPVAQALFCPMLDDRTAANITLDTIQHKVWNNKNNRYGWSCYLNKTPGQPTLPDYASAARRVDFNGLPATWINIGDEDLLYDECCAYANKLKLAGVSCELNDVRMAPHAFETIVPDAQISKDVQNKFIYFLKKQMQLESLLDEKLY